MGEISTVSYLGPLHGVKRPLRAPVVSKKMNTNRGIMGKKWKENVEICSGNVPLLPRSDFESLATCATLD